MKRERRMLIGRWRLMEKGIEMKLRESRWPKFGKRWQRSLKTFRLHMWPEMLTTIGLTEVDDSSLPGRHVESMQPSVQLQREHTRVVLQKCLNTQYLPCCSDKQALNPIKPTVLPGQLCGAKWKWKAVRHPGLCFTASIASERKRPFNVLFKASTALWPSSGPNG